MFRYIYLVIFGIILSMVASVTITFLYPYPKAPEPPMPEQAPVNEMEMGIYPSPAYDSGYFEAERKYQEDMTAYNKVASSHSLNLSLLQIATAVILVVISGLLLNKIRLFGEGFIAGAALLLLSITGSFIGYSGFAAAGYDSSALTPVHVGALYVLLLLLSGVGYFTLGKKQIH